MGWDSPSHWLIVLVVLVALFGYKKLPDASRSLGRSLRIFKTELKGMAEDDKSRENAAPTSPPAVQAAPPATAEMPAAQPQAQPAPPAAPAPPTSAE